MDEFDALKRCNKDTKYEISERRWERQAQAITDAVRDVAIRHGVPDDEVVFHLRNLAESIAEVKR